MPYGVDKSIGGDSKENDSWMERCVSHISGTNSRTNKPYTKGEKIAICKAQLRKNKDKKSSLEEEIVIEQETFDYVNTILANTVTKLVESKRVNTEDAAILLADSMLEKANSDIDILNFIFNR